MAGTHKKADQKADQKVADQKTDQKADEQRERAKLEKAGAQQGAESVADAVKRVADAAVAAVGKGVLGGPAKELFFHGTPGGAFEIRGEGFGPSGVVKVNGVQCHTKMWSTRWIKGDLPAEVGYGNVEVHVDDKTVRRGEFRAPVV